MDRIAILGQQGFSHRWQFIAVSIGAMVLLAGLDFTMALLAKEYADRELPWLALIGIMNAAILFFVYSRFLRTAELSVVTIGWVVFLQVGLVLMDRFYYGVRLPPTRWAAIVAIVALQVYLVLGNVNRSTAESTSEKTAAVAESMR